MKDKSKEKRVKSVHGITIWLDGYDDLFSDFDSREYDHRALSDDFLGEVKKIIREDETEEDQQELHLLLPANARDTITETTISHRLHAYFRNGYQRLLKEQLQLRFRGISSGIMGLIFLMAAGYLSYARPELLALHLLKVVLEPAGWFFVWIAYDVLFNGLIRQKAELEFHRRMTRIKILFDSLKD